MGTAPPDVVADSRRDQFREADGSGFHGRLEKLLIAEDISYGSEGASLVEGGRRNVEAAK